MCNWGPRLLPLNVHMNLPEKEFKFQDEQEFSIFNCQKQNKTTKSGYSSKMSRPPSLQGYKTSGHCKRKSVFDDYLWLQGSKLNQGQITILGRNLIILGHLWHPHPRKAISRDLVYSFRRNADLHRWPSTFTEISSN